MSTDFNFIQNFFEKYSHCIKLCYNVLETPTKSKISGVSENIEAYYSGFAPAALPPTMLRMAE